METMQMILEKVSEISAGLLEPHLHGIRNRWTTAD